MLAISFLLTTIISIARGVSASCDANSLSLLDIVDPDSASTLQATLDNSLGHTYIKPDLSDVDLLRVSIIDGNDDSVVMYMEMTTNANAAAYRKALYAEIDGEP